MSSNKVTSENLYIYCQNKFPTRAHSLEALLPYPIDIEAGKKVQIAALQLSLAQHWANIDNDCRLTIYLRARTQKRIRISLASGFYKTYSKLQLELNRLLGLASNKIEDVKADQIVKFVIPGGRADNYFALKAGYGIIFSPALQLRLNLARRQYENKAQDESELRISFVPDIFVKNHALMLSCDLVRPSVVGQAQYPILRLVPSEMPTEAGGILAYDFEPIFHDIIATRIHHIKVELRNQFDEPLKMPPGDVILLCHLRFVP